MTFRSSRVNGGHKPRKATVLLGLTSHRGDLLPTNLSDAIKPSHPLSSPSPPAFSLSQYQGLFQCVGSLYQVAKVLEFQLQHQSFQGMEIRVDFL